MGNSMTNPPEIPAFTLAKVHRKRDKGGAFVLFGAKGAGSISYVAGKIAVTALVGALSVGAYNSGKNMAPVALQKKKQAAPFSKVSSERKYEGDLSKLPQDVR